MLVVVVTANHFWLDGIVAAGLLGLSLMAVRAVEQVIGRLHAAPMPPLRPSSNVSDPELEQVVAALVRAGCVAAKEEAVELVDEASRQGIDVDVFVTRRITGEPLAWITGRMLFCGLQIAVVPGGLRAQMADRADGRTGRGRAARGRCRGRLVHGRRRDRGCPEGRPAHGGGVGNRYHPVAVSCAQANGVDALVGDLDTPLAHSLRGRSTSSPRWCHTFLPRHCICWRATPWPSSRK